MLPVLASGHTVARGALEGAGASTNFATLYNFPDGSYPTGLSSVNGMLFGSLSDAELPGGFGYVYAATTAGSLTYLYHFKSNPDGAAPDEVTAANGVLYGVTGTGGYTPPGYSGGCGTFFAVPYAGGETVSSAFQCGKSGYVPGGKLVRYNGDFFGETDAGGLNNAGTVFVAHEDGTISILYSFGASSGDGINPNGGLEELGGTLYGVTENGGANDKGTVFAILPSGAERIIHSFTGADGSAPLLRLTAVNGVLYGAASYGGANNRGTIFAITPSGAFTVLHSFGKNPDGYFPRTSLLAMGGALIGATFQGGLYSYGLLYKISYSGDVTRLHSFRGPDGKNPYGKLTSVGNTVYGTTAFGGANSTGGTMFGFKL